VEIHSFPDGESRVRLPSTLPEEVIFCRSLDHPNDKLVEFLFAVRTARQMGVRHLTLVAPYLCYMPQDMAFHPGEVVSQQIIGGVLAELFDALVTVDPHLHRVSHLDEVIPGCAVRVLSAASLMGNFIKNHSKYSNILLIGPDQESAQWVEAIASSCGLRHAVATKQRNGDHAVEVTLPDLDYRDQVVVVVDDVASTGCTLVETTRTLYARGAAWVEVLVTHALFTNESLQRLAHAGVRKVWSTDSITHTSNVVVLADLLAEGVYSLFS
jgi:ribose-phosphate pyrophosphokinase